MPATGLSVSSPGLRRLENALEETLSLLVAVSVTELQKLKRN